jgi:replicative DNA helicase
MNEPLTSETRINEGRVPPYSKDAEEAVLGAILLNNDALDIVCTLVRSESFYVETHRRIFNSMLHCAADGYEIDAVTLGNQLIKAGDLEKIGGPMALEGLTERCAAVANVEHYARIVAEMEAVRRMIYTAQQIVAEGYGDHDQAATYIANAQSLVASVEMRHAAKPETLQTDLHQVFSELEIGKKPEGVVPTGIEGLDGALGGLWPGMMTVLAARPSMGKSCCGENIAVNVAMSGSRVLRLDLESTRQIAARRLIARFAEVDLLKLMLNQITKEELGRVLGACSKLSQLPLWVKDMTQRTPDDIRSAVMAHKNRHGLDLLVVDHLRKINGKGRSPTEVMSDASDSMSRLAQEINVPLLMLAQLNRNVEGRPDKRPTLSDLRQSGTVEEDARTVIFLYRPGYYSGESDTDRRCEAIIAKASNGKTGTVPLWFRGDYQQFRSWDASEDGAFWDEKKKGLNASGGDFFKSSGGGGVDYKNQAAGGGRDY